MTDPLRPLRNLRALCGKIFLCMLACAPALAEEPIRIGFIATLSSPTSRAGVDLLDGFKLVLKEAGDKLGGRAVALTVGDDQLKPDVGVQLARKMLDEKVELVTGLVLTNVTLAIANAVLPRKTFMLSLNSGSSVLAGAKCSPYFFAVSYQADTLSEAVGIHLDRSGKKSVALIAANYAAGRDIMTGFKRAFKGQVAAELYTPLDQFDFAAEVAELRAAAPEATFFFYTSGAPAINFVKQYAAAGLKEKVPLYGINFSLDEQTLPGMGEAALGIEDSAFWTADLDNPENRAFVGHFTEEYRRPPSIFAAVGYDGARLLDAALSEVGGQIERQDEFRAAMEHARFRSVRGNFRFNTNHFPIQDFQLAEVRRNASGDIVNAYKGSIDKDHTDAYAGQCPMNK